MSNTDDLAGTTFGAAMAGLWGRVIFHPLDTAKAKIQVQKSSSLWGMSRSLPGTLWLISVRQGPLNLYQGFGVAALGSIPASILYYSAYSIFKTEMDDRLGVAAEAANDFVSGFLAEAVSCVLWVPIDVSKEQLQTQSELKASRHIGSWNALQNIIAERGFRGLYRGYGATLASFGPMSALYFTFYEQLKRSSCFSGMDQLSASQAWLATMSISSIAGGIAAVLTTPLDLVKMRLQVQRGVAINGLHQTHFHHVSFLSGLRELALAEGLRGMYRGAVARLWFWAPLTGFEMATMEFCKDWYLRHYSK